MSIFTRFRDIINSNINTLLDKAEDPQKMLRLMIQEMEDTLIDLKTSTAARMADLVKLEKKAEDSLQASQRWMERADMAIDRGKEDMAREALIEKKRCEEARQKTLDAIADLKNAIEEGKNEISTLNEKLNSSREKLLTLQKEQAKAKERTDFSDNLNARFEEMENRINRMNAYNDLSKRTEKTAEEKFRQMERDEQIEAELENMKKAKGL